MIQETVSKTAIDRGNALKWLQLWTEDSEKTKATRNRVMVYSIPHG